MHLFAFSLDRSGASFTLTPSTAILSFRSGLVNAQRNFQEGCASRSWNLGKKTGTTLDFSIF